MTNSEPDYGFLNDSLADFIRQKAGPPNEDLRPTFMIRDAFEEKVQGLVDAKTLSKEEAQSFIFAIENMTFEKLVLVSTLQSEFSQIVHTKQPFQFIIEPIQESKEKRALDWTILQIGELKLDGLQCDEVYRNSWDHMSRIISESLPREKPYRQCYWCGYIDYSESQFPSHREKYCHAEHCNQRTNSNPALHPDCCFGKWALCKRAYKEKLRYYTSLSLSPKEEQARIKVSFIKFCEERYQDNLDKEKGIIDSFAYGMTKLHRALQESPEVQKTLQNFEELRNKIHQYFNGLGIL